jgi:hypothetical protein
LPQVVGCQSIGIWPAGKYAEHDFSGQNWSVLARQRFNFEQENKALFVRKPGAIRRQICPPGSFLRWYGGQNRDGRTPRQHSAHFERKANGGVARSAALCT